MSAVALPLVIPRPGEGDLAALARSLDAATHAERIAWMWSLRRRQIGELYHQAEGNPITVDEVVRGDGPTTYEGRNALPLFNQFAKVFARVDGRVVGYNRNPPVVRLAVGSGHFELLPDDVVGQVRVEYRRIEFARTHESFPALRPNRPFWRRPGPYLTFGCMYDVVRRVSEHVIVGDSVRSLPGGAAFVAVRVP